MVELLVTVAIIAIVSAFGILSIVRQQRLLKLREMDETARQIYLAAQNQISYNWSKGTWDTYLKTLEKEGKTAGEYVETTEDGHTIIRLDNINGNATAKNTLDNYILPFGAIDDHVRNGSYIIDVDCDGAIYRVFYIDQQIDIEDDIDFVLENENNRDIRSTYKRNDVKRIIGYYGTGYLGGNQGRSLTPLSMSIHNEENLYLEIIDKNNYFFADNRYDDVAITINVKGATSLKSYNITLVPKTNLEEENYLWKKYETYDNIYYYYLLLDGITSKRFKDNFPELIPG